MSVSTISSRRHVALAVALLVIAVGFFTVTASANADTLKLAGGYTQLTTDPGTTKALVANKIVPLPVLPSWVVPTKVDGKYALNYRFYVTGGQIDSATLGGEIFHSGGLRFVNLRNGKSVVVRSFTIDTVNAQLTAYVPAVGARAPILDLDLSGVQVTPGATYTKVGPVPAALTDVAASVLNDKLRTSLFAGGIPLGTANVYARFAK